MARGPTQQEVDAWIKLHGGLKPGIDGDYTYEEQGQQLPGMQKPPVTVIRVLTANDDAVLRLVISQEGQEGGHLGPGEEGPVMPTTPPTYGQADVTPPKTTGKQVDQISAPPTQPKIGIADPSVPGGIRWEDNPNYVPPSRQEMTPAEKATIEAQQEGQRLQAARDAAAREQQRLANDIALGKIKADAALAEYDRWVQEHITGPIQVSQEERARAAEERQRQQFIDQQIHERAAYEQARQQFSLGYGQTVVGNYLRMQPYMVGPSFGAQMAKAINAVARGRPGDIKFSDEGLTYELPDLDQIARQAVAEALASQSPAAQAYLAQSYSDLQNGAPAAYSNPVPSADYSGAPPPYAYTPPPSRSSANYPEEGHTAA